MKDIVKTALAFVLRWRASFAWVALLLGLAVAGAIWPSAGSWLLALEVAVASGLWVTASYLAASMARREANRLRAERDAQTAIAHGLSEAIHQHMISTIRDRDCGPDAYQRAQELSDRARSIMFPAYYPQPEVAQPEPEEAV
jgi:hypothetical protein